MKKVILISAKARHGKDTVADMIKKQLESQGERVLIMHFAKYIKSFLKDYYGWDGVDKSEQWRTKLQFLGTEKIRQELNMPNFHVNRTCEDIKILEDDWDYILIPDTRFWNEVDYTKAFFPKKCIDVRIERRDDFGNIYQSDLTDEQKSHPSEIDLDDYDFSLFIPNRTLESLKSEVESFVKEAL